MIDGMLEAMNIVEKINEEIFDIFERNNRDWFFKKYCDLRFYGDNCKVYFLGDIIWDSEDDDREFLDKEEKNIEDLEEFIRKQIRIILSDISRIKL